MKTLFIILSLLFTLPAHGARFYPSPEVPNVTCADGIDNDADGTVDAADTDCATAATLTTDGGNGYRGNFKDAIAPNFTTAADATAGSGTYLKKTSDVAGFYVGEGALHASFTNATYYAWIRYRCSETVCAAWFSSSPIKGNLLNASQGMILANQATFTWIQVQYAGTNLNFYSGLNGGGNRTFALNGNGGIFFKGTDGLELDCLVLDPDIGATPDCPDTGGSQPSFNYEILEVGVEATPTDWNSAAFTNANVMTFSGYDNTNLTCTVKMLWDNAATDRLYISTNCNDTDDEIASVAEDSFSTQEDNVDFRWRLDTMQTFDGDMKMVVGNLQPVFADADWSDGGNRTFTPDFNTTVAKTVVASTSWQSFIAIDAGAVTADTVGLCNLAIRDKDVGVSATIKHLSGTTANALLNANEFANCKWSSTTVPASGGGGDVTAPTVNNTAETNLTTSSATITFDTDEAGTAFVVYGTGTGDYTFTSSTAACTSSCVITLTGLSSGTTYYYRAKITDAAGNTGQSAEDTAATTSASTADLFASATGSGTACSSGTPCTPATLLSQIVAGQIGEFAAGTYQGTAEMIDPPDNKNGTAANPITIRCATDGACILDGQSARSPINLLNNDYWIIEGFDAHSSGDQGAVVRISTGADNNIIRRVCAWDGPYNGNGMVFSLSSNTGNLLEDVCGFGSGRKIFGHIGANNLTIRRAWGVWEKNIYIGPKMTFTIMYNSRNVIYENVMGTVDEDMGATSINQPYGIFASDQPPSDYCINSKWLGSLAYVTAGATYNGGWVAQAWGGRSSDCLEFKDLVTYFPPTFSTKRPIQGSLFDGGSSSNPVSCPSCARYFTNVTEVGGASSSINTSTPNGWVVTNRSDTDTIAAMNSAGANPFQAAAGTGARMCFRYQNGTLTSTKLWPWPMDSRIGAAWDLRNGAGSALATFGSLTAPITTQMETIFGTIPAECKS